MTKLRLEKQAMSARILVVDDEADQVEILSVKLTGEGYRVLTADNGLDALNQARRFLPDLILLDVMMPDINGLSVCEILRCQPSTGRIPVILLTALGGQFPRLSGLESGADEFLVKPVADKELFERIESALTRSREKWQAAEEKIRKPS